MLSPGELFCFKELAIVDMNRSIGLRAVKRQKNKQLIQMLVVCNLKSGVLPLSQQCAPDASKKTIQAIEVGDRCDAIPL
jgi:hypothetical protein